LLARGTYHEQKAFDNSVRIHSFGRNFCGIRARSGDSAKAADDNRAAIRGQCSGRQGGGDFFGRIPGSEGGHRKVYRVTESAKRPVSEDAGRIEPDGAEDQAVGR